MIVRKYAGPRVCLKKWRGQEGGGGEGITCLRHRQEDLGGAEERRERDAVLRHEGGDPRQFLFLRSFEEEFFFRGAKTCTHRYTVCDPNYRIAARAPEQTASTLGKLSISVEKYT